MTQLFTTGYEGESIKGLVDKLINSGVNVLVDVRENPVSRKPGFGRRSLENTIQSAGLTYIHLQELGSPRPLRLKLENSGDYDAFFSAYRDFLYEYQESIDDVIEMGSEKKLCLLCFEKNPHYCHRKIIADFIYERTNRKIEVIHL